MKKKLKYALTLYLAFIAIISVVYGAYWIYTNVVSVNIQYNFSLSESRNGSEVTLTATLTDGGTPVNNANVDFIQCSDSSGTVVGSIGNNWTDSSGVAYLKWNAIQNGTYYFKAGYQVP